MATKEKRGKKTQPRHRVRIFPGGDAAPGGEEGFLRREAERAGGREER